MGISEPVTLKILSNSEMKELERQVIKLEELEKRKVKATQGLQARKTKGSGIFASTEGQDAIPSNIIRKRRKLEKGVGRNAESLLAGLDSVDKNKSSQAFVKPNQFKQLQKQVNGQEKFLKAFGRGQGFLQGASGLTTSSGIFGAGMGVLGKIPHIAIALSAAKIVYDKFASQFGAGGTKDTRKKVLADDVSDIGSETESDIDSGRKLFLSNPLKNQGLPGGRSNTQELRDGTRIYKLRREGTYT